MTKYLSDLRRWWSGDDAAQQQRVVAVTPAGAAAPVVFGKPPVLGQLRRGDGPRRVAIFLDDSNEAEFAFKWAAENLLDKAHDRCARPCFVRFCRDACFFSRLTRRWRASRAQRVPAVRCNAAAFFGRVWPGCGQRT
jgi:hypothetical protein